MGLFLQQLKTCLLNSPFRLVVNRWLFGNSRRVSGRHHAVHVGKSLLTGTRMTIRGTRNSVWIGDGMRLFNASIFIQGDGCSVHLCGPGYFSGTLRCTGTTSSIHIGAGTTAEGASLNASEGASIQIGNDCALGSGVVLQAGDAHAIVDEQSGERLNPAKSISIGRHVWIAQNAILLKGTVLGDGTIVGAASVVTHTLSPPCLRHRRISGPCGPLPC